MSLVPNAHPCFLFSTRGTSHSAVGYFTLQVALDTTNSAKQPMDREFIALVGPSTGHIRYPWTPDHPGKECIGEPRLHPAIS